MVKLRSSTDQWPVTRDNGGRGRCPHQPGECQGAHQNMVSNKLLSNPLPHSTVRWRLRLYYVVLTIGLVVYKGEDILSLWDIITFIIVTVPSSLLIKASDHKGCAVIQPGVSWMEEVSQDSSRWQQQLRDNHHRDTRHYNWHTASTQ